MAHKGWYVINQQTNQNLAQFNPPKIYNPLFLELHEFLFCFVFVLNILNYIYIKI